jgi:RNA polymerase primary sigma factor
VFQELEDRGVILGVSSELAELQEFRIVSRAGEDHRSNADRLLAEVEEYQPLWPEQEKILARRVIQGGKVAAEVAAGRLERTSSVAQIISRGEEARAVLLKSNLRFVARVAHEFRSVSDLSFDDLFQEGVVGLIEGIDRFDPERGVKLISYAVWWIRQAIRKATLEVGHPVRFPLNLGSDLARLSKAKRRLARLKGGVSPGIHELALALDWDEARVQFLSEVSQYRPHSMDQPISNGSDLTPRDVLPAPGPDPETAAMRRDRWRTISDVLRRLDPRDWAILVSRFGLDGEEPMTLEEIGKDFGVTRERIRQLESRVLKRLAEDQRLRDYDPNSGEL